MRQFILSIFVLVCFQITPLSAATFDFIAYADQDSDNDGHYEWGYDTFSVTEDNISLNASGWHWANYQWNKAYAYLDHGNAGIGVCKQLNSNNQCSPSSDDNITPRESLLIEFDQTVQLQSVYFKNGKHNPQFEGDFSLSVLLNGVWSSWQDYSLHQIFNSSLIGDAFAFYNPNTFNGVNDDYKQFYISSLTASGSLPTSSITAAVPAPGAFIMVLLGLIGLAVKNRKTSMSN